MVYDRIIIGGGIYGLYAALQCGSRGERVVVLEYEDAAFQRATFINQARVHMGYHYPRSFSTAAKSAAYFERFCRDYSFCLLKTFDQIYAISASFSWTSAEQFQKFCHSAGIRCERVEPEKFFKPNLCEGAFLTKEYTFDAAMLRDYFLHEIGQTDSVSVIYHARIQELRKENDCYRMTLADGSNLESAFVLNTTYASVNQILAKLNYEPFKAKYELCEIILCRADEKLKNVGITVMDGPFFSIMPFGRTGYHSLTSVTFTPHMTNYDSVPTFPCQQASRGTCSPQQLGNCNTCPASPPSAWSYMSGLAHKYLRSEYGFQYRKSLYSMKPVLMDSEIDDSRPTVIRTFSVNPTFISVLSGKVNTIYDLDEVLFHGGEGE
ncbi:FAD dependent oxidoreductase [Caprobacter fermentans]|uniref:FAD dependent oxidoreductase n=1 Tax=Caproicibacter fermentans TaxID=2576756 RepID=A0A6N8HX09_9FIRM|nr:FAD-dependent oxidoreductase [Caproicibacter fermentans]MVB09933.1 FAD dependent oxidoreductase [Caproicibacter fermentans]QNK42116.1 FAD-binding oxidoreductase [Caproicibacter fermentans]